MHIWVSWRPIGSKTYVRRRTHDYHRDYSCAIALRRVKHPIDRRRSDLLPRSKQPKHTMPTSDRTDVNQVMGVGVGGDYPLSAVITAEFSSTQYRGGIIAAVFAMQGLGQLAAALMTLIVVVAYKDQLQSVPSVSACTGQCTSTVDKMWRIIIAFGGVPGWFALYYRLTIPGESCQALSESGTDKYRNTALHLRCSLRCRESNCRCEEVSIRKTGQHPQPCHASSDKT